MVMSIEVSLHPGPRSAGEGTSAVSPAALLVLFAALPVHPTAAQDTVYVSSASNPQGYLKLSGRIADYSGEGLNIELTGGVPRSIPAEQILKIETNYSRPQVEADRLFAQGEFESALGAVQSGAPASRGPGSAGRSRPRSSGATRPWNAGLRRAKSFWSSCGATRRRFTSTASRWRGSRPSPRAAWSRRPVSGFPATTCLRRSSWAPAIFCRPVPGPTPSPG